MANMSTKRLEREYRENSEFFCRGLDSAVFGNPMESLFFDRGMLISLLPGSKPYVVRYVTFRAVYLSRPCTAKRGKRTGPWLG